MPSLKHVSLRQYLKSMIVGGLYDVPREALSWGALYAVCAELGRYTDHRFKIKRIPNSFRVYKLPKERTMTFRKWMKEMGILAVMVLFLLPVLAFAGQKTINFGWDKTVLEPDLAGFNLYIADLPAGPWVKLSTVPFVAGQTHYIFPQIVIVPDNVVSDRSFTVDAYDTSGNLSIKSNVVTLPIDFQAPGGATNFTATIQVTTP